jgi:hypothetical protein
MPVRAEKIKSNHQKMNNTFLFFWQGKTGRFPVIRQLRGTNPADPIECHQKSYEAGLPSPRSLPTGRERGEGVDHGTFKQRRSGFAFPPSLSEANVLNGI